ncbi:unnamed protein product [Absidia cylindrospora]
MDLHHGINQLWMMSTAQIRILLRKPHYDHKSKRGSLYIDIQGAWMAGKKICRLSHGGSVRSRQRSYQAFGNGKNKW